MSLGFLAVSPVGIRRRRPASSRHNPTVFSLRNQVLKPALRKPACLLFLLWAVFIPLRGAQGDQSQEAEKLRSAVPSLITVLKGESSVSDRRAAAQALGRLGPTAAAAVPALVRALSDSDWEVRQAAAWALGRIGPVVATDRAAVRILSGFLTDLRQRAEVREAAAWTLGRIGPAGAGASLLKGIEAPDPSVRQSAAWALGQGYSSLESVQGLIRLLQDPEEAVRQAAIQALVTIGPDAISLLLAGLNHPVPETRRAAASALQRFGAEAVGPLPETRRAAASVLQRFGPEAVGPLKQVLLNSGEPEEMHEAAANILGGIGPDAIPALTEALANSSGKVRAISARALGQIGTSVRRDRRAVEGLLAGLSDPDWQVREASARAAGEIELFSAKSDLDLLLDDPEEAVRQAAAWALDRLGTSTGSSQETESRAG